MKTEVPYATAYYRLNKVRLQAVRKERREANLDDCRKKEKAWRVANRGRENARAKEQYTKTGRNLRLLKAYGISEAEYLARSTEQGNRCKICTKESKLFVDHNHKTGEVRGLLCSSCNFAIGHLYDSRALALAAALYLQVEED